MEDYMRVATLDNEIEALLVESVLTERGIPHLLESFHDTAYDGLFQAQKGWGLVAAPESRRDEVLEILRDLRSDQTASP